MRALSLTIPLSLALALQLTACAAGIESVPPECGDGVLDSGEECDLGAANSDVTPDGCRRDCRLAHCGDGVVDTGEECDDGNAMASDGCSPACAREPGCGDGFLDVGEECDDGNLDPGDGCNASCQFEFICGDGTCDTASGEACLLCPDDCCPCGDAVCDNALGETCSLCREDCCPDCGDTFLDPTEQCDDGNNVDGDGCSAACIDEDGTPTCGNGIWEAGELCEDGNTQSGDGCSATCQFEWVCGDGTCDSATGETCQLCPADCCPNCGNGFIDPGSGEECDQADVGGLTCTGLCYTGGFIGCTTWCTLDTQGCTGSLPVCGNGAAECNEACDGADLGNTTCDNLGRAGGTLACDASCNFDLTNCGPVAFWLEENFDAGCPAGWTLAGDWQCGTPTSGPGFARSPPNAIGTQLGGNYSNNQSWVGADSPPVDLTFAVTPIASFYAWVRTEGFTYDGFNLKVSTDGGTNFGLVSTVTPAYSLTVGGESAWGGDQSGLGYQQYTADLGAYAGQSIILRFSFRTDGSVLYPGVYFDDVIIAEFLPVEITTATVPDATIGDLFSTTMAAMGGSGAYDWSIAGGTNHAWLSIDPATGVLSGTPGAGDAGPVTVTIEVQDPTQPGNVDSRTFTLTVRTRLYSEDFDAGCPAGWTFGGDWQCGSPSSGPGSAYSGSSCVATQLGGNYGNNQAWGTAVATSPPIDLSGTTAPVVSFWAWLNTEGFTYDGANLKISSGGPFSLVTTVQPPYNLTVGGEPAWGGDQSGSGWQPVSADLSAYAGQTVQLQVAFRSDGSVVRPGVYFDDISVAD